MNANLRMISTITAKDILDAIKNRNTLANIVVVFLIMLLYSGLPVWERGDSPPNLLIFDAGDSSLVAALKDSAAVKLDEYPSQAAMEERVGRGDEHELGLVIPADYASKLVSGDRVELDGYAVRWVSESAASELISWIEAEIARATDQTITIMLDDNRVDVSPSSSSPVFSASLNVVLALLMIGVGVVPHLMIEEKENKTLDVILASPAESSHIVIAKALTGLLYCLVTVTIVFAFNAAFVAHWELPALVAIAGSLFSVALGLLFGTLFEVKQQLTLWGFVALTALLVPIILSSMSDALPSWLTTVVHWIPTATMAYLFQLSCRQRFPGKLWAGTGPGDRICCAGPSDSDLACATIRQLNDK